MAQGTVTPGDVFVAVEHRQRPLCCRDKLDVRPHRLISHPVDSFDAAILPGHGHLANLFEQDVIGFFGDD